MTLPDGARIGAVRLRVHDAETLAPFYAAILGIEPEARDGTVAFAADSGMVLELVGDPTAAERSPQEAGLYHVAYRFPSREALGSALERMDRAGITVEGGADHGVSEAVYLTDTEGNGVECYYDRDRSAWERDADGRIRMVTKPLDVDAVRADAGRDAPAVVGHVHLEVLSLEESTGFYRDVLGFTVEAAVNGARFLGAGGYHHHVGMNVWRHRSKPKRRESVGLDRFTVTVPSPDAVEAVAGRARERGMDIDRDGAALAVADPSGVRVRVEPDQKSL